jgi:CheY-like chemotaxis protein
MSEAASRVLVVEDTPTQSELARALLRGLGYEVRIAAAAGPAFEIARDWHPDAILLDIELPDYNGFELLKQLRQEGITADTWDREAAGIRLRRERL